MFTAIINTPGCLPDSTEPPPIFETCAEAWDYLVDSRLNALTEEQESADFTVSRMIGHAAMSHNHGIARLTSESGPTPGHEGDHDLGLVYSVQQVECECAYQPGDSSHELHCPLRTVDVLS
jgi:hypothetical protein